MFGDDPIEQIRLAVKDLDAEDRREWSGAARSDQLIELLEIAERLQAEIVRSVGEWDARKDWALDGALSPRTWLTQRAPISGVGASKLVGMARLARAHEATGKALRSGDVSCAHVEVLAPMLRERESEYARNEELLLSAAKTMRADDFGLVARHWRGIADDERSRLDAAASHARRNLHVHTSLFGMGVLEGTSTRRAPKSSSKPWTIARRRMRWVVRCHRGRWRNGVRMRWSTSAAAISVGRVRAPRPWT